MKVGEGSGENESSGKEMKVGGGQWYGGTGSMEGRVTNMA